MGYSLSMKKIFYLIFFASFFVIALSTFSSKALAGSCTISSGNIDDFEGLIVHVAVLNNNGTIDSTPAITGYTMGLTSNANGGTGGNAGIRRVNQKKEIIESYSGVMFSPVTTACTDTNRVDSYNAGDMVLDYGVSSNNVSAIPTPKNPPVNDTGWVLGCGTTSNPGSKNGEGRLFTMKMNGNPTGTVPDGTWLYYYDGQKIPTTGSFTWSLADKQHGGINGLTMQFNAVYVPPKTNIQGTVYSAVNKELSGVQISGTNVPTNRKTGSNGSFTFGILAGASFSIRAVDPFTSADGHKHSGVKITPYGSKVTQCTINNIANSTSYELQVAGTEKSIGACNYRLTGNSGYDFQYTKEQYAKIAVAGTVTPSEAYPGTTVDFTGSATVSQALPDDGDDTYRITITPSIAPPNSGDTTTFKDCYGASSTSTQKLYLNAFSSSSKSLSCQIKIPAGSTAGTQYCVTTSVFTAHDYVKITGDNLIKVDNTGYKLIKCVKVLAPPTISLGAAPSHEIGSGENANISYKVNCNDFRGSITYQISVSSTPASSSAPSSLESTTNNCTANPTLSGTISNKAADLDGVAPNNYTYSPSITAAKGVPNLPISGTAVTLDNYTVPYARFYGADIMSQGDIVFNVNSLTDATGSATQYAAVAKKTITLATAAFRSGKVNTLTAIISAISNISSSNNTSGGTWANDFNTSGYYGDVSKTTTINSKAGATGKVTVVGNDIYITGDITVDTTNLPGPPGSAFFNDSLTPSLVFIAAQNIYIDHTVHRIDASLQAGSNIYTCADTSKTPVTAVANGSNCQTPLTVNGSVGAKAIKFNRSCGTRLKAASGEDNTPKQYGLLDRGSICPQNMAMAAEVFNLPNYLYFTSSTGSSASQTQFQSIYSAPPLL